MAESAYKWTCGECGDRYEAEGPMAATLIDSWVREHKRRHSYMGNWDWNLPEDDIARIAAQEAS
jgi:hypothetical protein